ncbi:hypothetical protein DY000_02029263 [Brassica cretica]|uniref:Uncharacterized protein n=1 Tax=Brassica cretica TaxID=69181 RepID=A0ABQ7DTC7_BRACR|nr:hypothetical protein DY000_02029263 [Brassica cretica]
MFAPTKVSDYIRYDLKQKEFLTEFVSFFSSLWRTEDAAHRIVQRERRGVRMSRAAASKGKKKGGVSFTIDCSKPVDDKIMEIA